MTDITAHFSGATWSFGRLVALLRRWLTQAAAADDMRRALDELPDAVLKDIGLTRREIPFVARAIAARHHVRSSGIPTAWRR